MNENKGKNKNMCINKNIYYYLLFIFIFHTLIVGVKLLPWDSHVRSYAKTFCGMLIVILSGFQGLILSAFVFSVDVIVGVFENLCLNRILDKLSVVFAQLSVSDF